MSTSMGMSEQLASASDGCGRPGHRRRAGGRLASCAVVPAHKAAGAVTVGVFGACGNARRHLRFVYHGAGRR